MGIYIGIIEKSDHYGNFFYNYKPIAEVKNNQVITLSFQEQEALLPDSEKRNICFAYDWDVIQECHRMDEVFSEKSLVLFEFDLSDLLPNTKANGDRNLTGYKVSAMEMLNKGKIRPIGNFGVYFAVGRDEVLSDFTNDTIVEIKSSYVLAGSQVFIEMDEGDFWAGPYEVGYREYTSSYYVKPQIKENKYTIRGYYGSQIEQFDLTNSEGHWGGSENKWTVLCPKQGESREQKDVIPNSVLIESFKDSIKSEITADGKIKLDDIPALLKQYEESEIMSPVLTSETRRTRLNRLVDIMSSEVDVDETLRIITDFVCDLLVKYHTSKNVEEWVQNLLEKHPELLDQLKSTQTISKRITELEYRCDELEDQKHKLEKEIEESRQSADAIDQQAIKGMLAQKNKEYNDLVCDYNAYVDRLEVVKKTLGVADDVSALQKRYDDLTEDCHYLEGHKKHLDIEAGKLELQFQQIVSNAHEKMVGIAFDGFMASKMLHAAAEWETEQDDNQYANLINKVADLSVCNKEPDELVEYLCRVINTCRPNYSKNTIINIAICLTQGFLTVFSGEPGCGKTSICNIFGEILGLNKISDMIDCSDESKEIVKRYLSVSVERGWTSKRDFVGYYNPLSKTFDKSNRRIYDALRQLDAEKRAGIFKLPYIILLDEANLSPMEYYWSDFMNVCDDLGTNSKVNLGEDYVFGIPETLHFVATINNDHTIEQLSPRLIDRAWVIMLPQMTLRDYGSFSTDAKIPTETIDVISWESLCNAFAPAGEACFSNPDIQKCYESIIIKLREQKFLVSSRVDKAIKRYWSVASKYFEMDDTKTDATIIALDYAISQRILPKINGNGEEFEKWLNELSSLCSSNGLNTSATILKEIIERGNRQMKDYRFFC